VALICRPETSSAGSEVTTCAALNPVPVIWKAFVSPRRIEAGENVAMTGGAALPAAPRMT